MVSIYIFSYTLEKKAVYRRIKFYGFLSYIPVILAVGPLSAWALGDYLKKKFGLPDYVPQVFAGLGLIAAVMEIVRVIKLVSKVDKDN